jgi:hypothetical protein
LWHASLGRGAPSKVVAELCTREQCAVATSWFCSIRKAGGFFIFTDLSMYFPFVFDDADDLLRNLESLWQAFSKREPER